MELSFLTSQTEIQGAKLHYTKTRINLKEDNLSWCHPIIYLHTFCDDTYLFICKPIDTCTYTEIVHMPCGIKFLVCPTIMLFAAWEPFCKRVLCRQQNIDAWFCHYSILLLLCIIYKIILFSLVLCLFTWMFT